MLLKIGSKVSFKIPHSNRAEWFKGTECNFMLMHMSSDLHLVSCNNKDSSRDGRVVYMDVTPRYHATSMTLHELVDFLNRHYGYTSSKDMLTIRDIKVLDEKAQ